MLYLFWSQSRVTGRPDMCLIRVVCSGCGLRLAGELNWVPGCQCLRAVTAENSILFVALRRIQSPRCLRRLVKCLITCLNRLFPSPSLCLSPRCWSWCHRSRPRRHMSSRCTACSSTTCRDSRTVSPLCLLLYKDRYIYINMLYKCKHYCVNWTGLQQLTRVSRVVVSS